jgi:hypothetical protein
MGQVSKHPHSDYPESTVAPGSEWLDRGIRHRGLDKLEPGHTNRPRPPEGAQPTRSKQKKYKRAGLALDAAVNALVKSGVNLHPTNRKERRAVEHFLYCMDRSRK